MEIHENLIKITTDKFDILVRNLAQNRLAASFGYIYARFFGSHIFVLKSLSGRRRIPAPEVYEIFRVYDEKFHDLYKDYSFSGWLEFLKGNNLVLSDGDELKITAVGDEFLI